MISVREESLSGCYRRNSHGTPIRSVIESTVFPNNLRVTISAGVATQDDPLGRIDFLLKNADDALYQAKREGRNKVIVYSAI
nr:diguanylate cyclase [Escherichia coli]